MLSSSAMLCTDDHTTLKLNHTTHTDDHTAFSESHNPCWWSHNPPPSTSNHFEVVFCFLLSYFAKHCCLSPWWQWLAFLSCICVFVYLCICVFVYFCICAMYCFAIHCSAKHCCPPGGGKPLIVAVVTKAGAGQSTLSVLSSPTQPIPFVQAQVIVFPK